MSIGLIGGGARKLAPCMAKRRVAKTCPIESRSLLADLWRAALRLVVRGACHEARIEANKLKALGSKLQVKRASVNGVFKRYKRSIVSTARQCEPHQHTPRLQISIKRPQGTLRNCRLASEFDPIVRSSNQARKSALRNTFI